MESLELKVFVWIKTHAHRNQKHLFCLVVLGGDEPVQNEDDGEDEIEVEGGKGYNVFYFVWVKLVAN